MVGFPSLFMPFGTGGFFAIIGLGVGFPSLFMPFGTAPLGSIE